jgi:gliding motility-associated-like protein
MKTKLIFQILLNFILSISAIAQCDFGTGLVGSNNAPFAAGSGAVNIVGNNVTVTSNVNIVAGVYNFDNFTVNNGVVITVTAGVGPLIIKCTGTATINGAIRSDGGDGGNGTQGVFSGGIGGAGGIGAAGWGTNGGLGGSVGLGVNGNPGVSFGTSTGAGLGGVGNSSSGPWSAGAGGGAGYSTTGTVGSTTDGGAGGAGGAAYGDVSLTTIMTQSAVTTNLLGGSGGGGGGNRGNISRAAGGGGGGGGGAIQITATSINFSPTGLISVKGGNGGTSTNNGGAYGGSGGGGSGGTLNLKSNNIVGFVQATNSNISGGIGGASSGANGGPATGGNGAEGRILLEACAPLANSISTGTITGSPFCAGATFNVPFTSTGTFAGGNVYTAQLSDAAGSFASPTVIGTLNSTANSGTIAASIPGGTSTGTGYLIRVISSNPSINGSSTVAFTINAPITPTFTAIPNVCQNATAPILPTTSNNGINGTWAPPVSTATPGTTNYTFTPNAGQCANTATLSITVDALVTPTFAQIGPLCVGSVAPSLSLSSTNTPAINGTWSPSTINTAAVGIATYTFTPDAGQCATSATMSIEITNSITPTFSAIGPVCQGSPTVLLPQNSTNIPPISGSWTPFMSINTTNAGTTTYTFTPNAGQCASLYNVDIIVTPPTVTPTFNAIGPLCIGAVPPALPLFSTNTPAVVGIWSPAVINTSAAGTSTYTFTPDGGQCAVPTTIDITVTSSITPTFALIGPLCIGSAAPILPAASNNVPAITGTWSPAAINTAVPGTTTYSFTADPNQCATNTSMDIVVTNSITATFNTISPVCQGVTAPSLPAISTNNPPITGSWNPAVINTGTVGTSTYTFTPDPGQCAGNVSLDIEVVPTPPSPSISISASVTSICAGESVNFTASPNSSNTGDVIQWFVNGTAVIGGTGLLFSSNTLNNNDQITAVFTPSSSCLAGQSATSNLIVITVNPVVTPVVNITASATQICTGENVTFTSTITGGGTNPQYQWFINGNAVAGATNATFVTSNFQNADNVTLQLISNQPCASPTTVISNIVTMSVTSLATPTVSIIADKNIICESQQVVFTATANFGGTSPQYIWQVGNNTFTTTDAQFTATGITSNTNVTCTLVSNFLCTTSDTALSNSLNIQVNPIPTVVLSNDVTIQQGESTTLTATTAANLTYLWTPSTALSCTDCTVTEANPEESITYTFTVTDPATNCSAADSVVVTVIRTFDVWVPNAFSPNKDGVNDIFFVRGNNVKDFALKIFDRWGTLMFETSNLNDGWNGEYQGRIVNTGIFVYTLDYTLKEGTQGTLKGNISVSN